MKSAELVKSPEVSAQPPSASTEPPVPKFSLSKSKIRVLYTAYILILIVCAYIATLFIRSWLEYRWIKPGGVMLSAGMYRFNPVLGFSPRPDHTGYLMHTVGPDTPYRYDADGFRIPLTAAESTNNTGPLVLALGC